MTINAQDLIARLRAIALEAHKEAYKENKFKRMNRDMFSTASGKIETPADLTQAIRSLESEVDSLREIMDGHLGNMQVAAAAIDIHPFAFMLALLKEVLELYAQGCYVSRGTPEQRETLVKFIQDCVPVIIESTCANYERENQRVSERAKPD